MSFKLASLAQLFEPPTGYRGLFGWLCGYAAGADFLEDALERFSGLTRAQRAHQGRILLAAMLDPGNSQIGPVETPGALHLPVKVAKLPVSSPCMPRSLSLASWMPIASSYASSCQPTIEQAKRFEKAKTLAWHVDVFSKDAGAEVVRQNRTDLAAVWDFLLSLQESFDLRLLEFAAVIDNESAGRQTHRMGRRARPPIHTRTCQVTGYPLSALPIRNY
jgi:hypothetical protein